MAVGPPGAGKTHLLRSVARHYAGACLILDVNGEWEGYGADVCDYTQLGRVVAANPRKDVVFHPPNLSPTYFEWALQVALSRRVHVGPTIFVCDEIRAYRACMGPDSKLSTVLSRRRHHAIGFAFGTQRSAYLSDMISGAWSHLVTFRMQDPNDKRWLRGVNYSTYQALEGLDWNAHEYLVTLRTGQVERSRGF